MPSVKITAKNVKKERARSGNAGCRYYQDRQGRLYGSDDGKGNELTSLMGEEKAVAPIKTFIAK